jgi:hypothetical protein
MRWAVVSPGDGSALSGLMKPGYIHTQKPLVGLSGRSGASPDQVRSKYLRVV